MKNRIKQYLLAASMCVGLTALAVISLNRFPVYSLDWTKRLPPSKGRKNI